MALEPEGERHADHRRHGHDRLDHAGVHRLLRPDRAGHGQDRAEERVQAAPEERAARQRPAVGAEDGLLRAVGRAEAPLLAPHPAGNYVDGNGHDEPAEEPLEGDRDDVGRPSSAACRGGSRRS